MVKVTDAGARHAPRKRFGQHFLEPAWVDKVIAAVAPRAGQRVLEIGPGSGQLTAPLSRAGVQVVAVEVDRDLAARLRRRHLPGVDVVTADVLATDLSGCLAPRPGAPAGDPVRVVGNLPYNLSSPILFTLLDQRGPARFADATLMLQREVADRVVAGPGTRDYGPLAILTRVAAETRLLLRLPPGAFRPPPRVASALVHLSFRPSPVRIADPALFSRMVRALFSRRRKTLLNALAPFAAERSAGEPRALIRRAGLDPGCRAETLGLGELAALAETVAGAVGGRDRRAAASPGR